jgi:sugar lactone lactonase YvrE
MSAITAPGDMNSDGRPDVIARDTTGELWLYPNNGAGDWLNPSASRAMHTTWPP